MSAADIELTSREADRIRAEYARRRRELSPETYDLTNPAALYQHQGAVRAVRSALDASGVLPLGDRRILDVGCGRGDWLLVFDQLGARRDRLAGIDLDEERAGIARRRLAGADVRCGDASMLPWPDASFDLVFQSTMFTSILNARVRTLVAEELMRVLAPAGVIVWYDFTYNNPDNPHVRGVRPAELRALFPRMRARIARVTLAPPLLRRIVPWSPLLADVLQATRVLNTHIVATLQHQ